ncbi:MAG: hypothetical protein HND44_15880 [Chloroflexi bacterium]|nr:DinB family protein [Ardenticatenaceae bacterium]MBL1129941.1 hypothetical protein [Chloroflexota bacterium]NOG36027.1 hypothetical protein [Chloroflexota bacterium]GIK57177.1 MAG: hypothetical protein BroJett015_28400 [Chloroflexota bacterium]
MLTFEERRQLIERIRRFPAELEALVAGLQVLWGLHGRWATVFAGLSEADWQRVGVHPADGEITVEDLLRNYVAHGQAHLDQIRRVLAARGVWV